MGALAVLRRLDCADFEIVGKHDRPVIAVLGGISATRHVTAGQSRCGGWWQDVVGPRKAVDTDTCSVLSFDYVAQNPDGQCARSSDQAHQLARVMDVAGVDKVQTIVGASYGGMVALSFAALYPHRVGSLVVISAAHASHPMATGLRSMQRRVVELGMSTDRGRDALKIARGIAMTTYRTAEEFADRFSTEPNDADSESFPVEDYLMQCGERFANSFTPARFVSLSLSLDLHYVIPEEIQVPTTLVSVDTDALVPPWQMRELASRLGGPSRLIELKSRYGHDAFLKEPRAMSEVIAASLSSNGCHSNKVLCNERSI
ncbi:MAG TPA: homoserine O-succinyltransferase [Gemmatimonadaceae bacterium]|nr:homoserine O-succinyltransferase [Gemmatimonadaceae bacterium]